MGNIPIKNENIRVLDSIAKRTNRVLTFNEQDYNSSRPARYKLYKLEAFMPNNEKGLSYFVNAYDSYYTYGNHAVYSGAFIPVSLPKSAKFSIRKKTIIDQLKFIFGDKTLKTGNSAFDAKVVITGNDKAIIFKYLGDPKVQEIILESFEISPLMFISLNAISNDFVPQLKGLSQLGIYDSHKWFFEREQIDRLLNLAEKLRQHIN